MNTNLIDYINLERISFVYKGTKYFITPEKNLSKSVNDSSVTFYYENDSKISFNLYEGESLFIELQEIVELFKK